MKKTFLAVSVSLLASVVSLFAQTQEEIDGVVNALMNRNRILGTEFAVVKDGKIIHTAHYGMKDTTGTPFNGDEIYPIASVSKSFTAAAIMTLVDRGVIKLDDDVNKYLPIGIRNPRYPDTPITIRMFLNHTSSILDAKRGINVGLDALMPDENENWASHYAKYAPGEGYTYGNLCYNILGIIVERVTGIRYDIYVRKMLLEPLGINASYNINDLDKSKFTDIWMWYHISKYFGLKPGMYKPVDFSSYKIGRDADKFHGCWGIHTDINGLARWMMFLMNRGELDGVRVLSEEAVREMEKGTILSTDNEKNVVRKVERLYGLGLYETENWIPGKKACGHAGYITGIRTSIMFNADEKWGVAMITPLMLDHDGYGFITDMSRTLHGLFIGFTPNKN